VIPAELVEQAASTLASSIDLGDGGTEEQQLVLQAMVDGYWNRPDLKVGALSPVSPDEAAAVFTSERIQHRMRQFLVLLEFCRHPISEAQATQTEKYAAALGGHGPGLSIARTLVTEGAGKALLDFQRVSKGVRRQWSEQSMLGSYEHLEEPDHELAALLRSFHDGNPGTLGYEYVEFYRRNAMTLPGDDPSQPAFFVSHDMNHVLAGYEPSAIEEISLSGFLLAAADTDANWILLLTSIAAYEAGFLTSEAFEGKQGVLGRPGAAATFAEALRRGAKCAVDFSHLDHLALANRDLDEVRRELGIEPRRC